jgi:Increased loss of mitochondrial DNA protein 1
VLFVVGITDLVSCSLPEEISQYHWGSQGISHPIPAGPLSKTKLTQEKAPVRLFLFGAIAFYSYTFSDSSPLYAQTTYHASSWGEGLKNRVVFTWAFVEMIAWFWLFVTLREERRDIAIRIAERRAAEEDRL